MGSEMCIRDSSNGINNIFDFSGLIPDDIATMMTRKRKPPSTVGTIELLEDSEIPLPGVVARAIKVLLWYVYWLYHKEFKGKDVIWSKLTRKHYNEFRTRHYRVVCQGIWDKLSPAAKNVIPAREPRHDNSLARQPPGNRLLTVDARPSIHDITAHLHALAVGRAKSYQANQHAGTSAALSGQSNTLLIDRGANGSVAGKDSRRISGTGRTVNVTDFEICNVGSVIDTQRDPVVGIMNQYAYSGKEDTIHSSIQMESCKVNVNDCLLYTSPSPRDLSTSRMPSSA